MSRIFRHLQLNDAWDIIWTICLSISLCILIVTTYLSVRTLQHSHCIYPLFDAVPAVVPRKIGQRHLKAYSTLSVVFATLSAVVSFLVFPVCAQWKCLDTVLGYILDIIFWAFYMMTKIFLYLLFIERLFNPHLYLPIYQYPKYIQYSLWMLVMVLIICLIASNVMNGLVMAEFEYPVSIEVACLAVYGIIDCTLSISLLFFFFRPIFSRGAGNTVSVDVYMSVVRRYAAVSALQLVVAVSAQIVFGIQCYLVFTLGPLSIIVRVFTDIMNVLQILDCLLLVICIYFGFVRQETVCLFMCHQIIDMIIVYCLTVSFYQNKSCCYICIVFCEWCICGCFTCERYREVYDDYERRYRIAEVYQEPPREPIMLSSALIDSSVQPATAAVQHLTTIEE